MTRRALGGFALTAALASPAALFALTSREGQVDWLPAPSAGLLVRGLVTLAGGRPLLAVCAVAVALGLRRSDRSTALAVAWLAVPIGLSFALSFVKPIFYPHYLIVALPGLLLLVGQGIAKAPRLLTPLLVAGLVCATGLGLTRAYDRDKEEWRTATERVLAESRPGDGIAFYHPVTRTPFEYYVLTAGRPDAAPEPLFPAAEWGAYALGEYRDTFDLAVLDDRERIWLVTSHAAGGARERELAAVEAALDGYRQSLSWSFKGLEVRRFDASGPGLRVQ